MAKLIFLGTKGEIEEETPVHRFHSSLIIESGETRVLIDYGLLRQRSLDDIAPDAVLITHAHPDHYSWLKEDIQSGIPVYCTQETLDYGKFKPENARVVIPMKQFRIGGVRCSAYRVIHSIRCPAVGWKLGMEGKTLVYNSDLVDIEDKDSVLEGVDYYIGDGSAVRANLVRRRGDVLFGHTRVITQVHWCQKFGIKNIIFTHLGKETLREESNFKADHPEVIFAYDGMELEI
jgi:Predicted exonuclease of the beta-lactamase fold involved in RNA processing